MTRDGGFRKETATCAHLGVYVYSLGSSVGCKVFRHVAVFISMHARRKLKWLVRWLVYSKHVTLAELRRTISSSRSSWLG